MEQDEIDQLRILFRKYLEYYINDNTDITDQAKGMYSQVFNWMLIDDAENKYGTR